MSGGYEADTNGYKDVANISDNSVRCSNCGSREIKRKLKPGHIRRNCHGRDIERKCGNCGEELGEYIDDTMEIRQRDPRWLSKNNDSNEINYGPNWDSIKRRVRVRDSWECKICGDERGKENLHVHHITPIREFEKENTINYEEANSMNNLVTLCPSCHGTVEGEFTNLNYEEFIDKFNT